VYILYYIVCRCSMQYTQWSRKSESKVQVHYIRELFVQYMTVNQMEFVFNLSCPLSLVLYSIVYSLKLIAHTQHTTIYTREFI